MISQEEFVKRVLDGFEDIREKIKENESKILKLHEKFNIHLKVEEELEKYKKEEKERVQKTKNRRVWLTMGLMTIAFTIYQIYMELFT